MIHYLVMLCYSINERGIFFDAVSRGGAEAGEGFVAADQGEEGGHFRAAVAAGERAAQRVEQRLAGAAARSP